MKPTIIPFKGTYYNSDLIKDFSKVVCPPYDIINKRDFSDFLKKSEYNFCNILLNFDGDYKKIGIKFREWLDKKILIDDDKESIYLYEQKFNFNSKKFVRFGIISLLWMKRKDLIIPHEFTLKSPKEDRRKIIREVNANLSPIFIVSFKKLQSLRKIYRKYFRKKPLFSLTDYEGNLNRVWKISDKKDIDSVLADFNNQKFLIADGHHRFEVAYEFYKENKNKFKDLDYVLSYITDPQKGLLVLPIHRIVHFDSQEQFFKELEKYFYVQRVLRKNLFLKFKESKTFCCGLYKSFNFYFLRLKENIKLDKRLKGLDSYELEEVLKKFFKDKDKVMYSHNLEEAINLTSDNKALFILREPKLSLIFKIVEKRVKLPQKSTFFYPKILSGLILRRFKKNEDI